MARRILIAALAAAIVGAFALAAAQIPEDKQVLKLETKMGTVTFEHAKHAGFEGVECQTCHHTFKGEGLPQACGECHGKKDDAPKLQKAVHARCWGCHQEKADAGAKHGPLKGAKNCKKCHVKG
ncbi:MAG: hypothetical protein D6738_09420 [Acidobacteria bacterium]|nr:MAG: hypothetical protein D6738_09420 [Acidobacteriota bacterium]